MRFILLLIISCLIMISSLIAMEYDPVANPKAIVISENARFTILTPRVIRMEWSEDGKFEDHASLVFVNRNLPVPKFKKKTRDGWLEISTKNVELKYKIGSGKFSKQNLVLKFDVDGKEKVWKPGQENAGNLLGTIRTLDGFDGEIMQWSGKEPIALEPGMLSTEGWVLIDDSEKPIFDNSEWAWVLPRPEKQLQDQYFFAYGLDYKTALKDFTAIAGKIALPPKYAFGNWWSRYWEYTDVEFRELVEEFEIHDVPLDVLVVDMDWHLTSKPEWYKDGKKIKDQAGEGIGWTGLTWNRNYFPDPAAFLQWTNEKGLTVCMNLHPASGIQPFEEKYPEMALALGIDPASNKYVPFDIVNKGFAKNFMDIILQPMEEDGVDFWWLDWQQWSTTSITGVNPTFYLNYVFFSDMERRGEKRPMIFHRYGGLGNHRYQIGFSGDTYINWKSLDYQPYFTATAANVGFGFWSHDIGGHMRGESTPELYTRWIQFGIFSPIFRTHATKANYSNGIERRIWAYPLDEFYIMRDAFHLRKALFPYIYTAAREAYDTGISICRPMYYDHPKSEAAYGVKNQYMFGNDIIAAPITQAIDEGSLIVEKDIWLPEGEWIEMYSGTMLEGNKTYRRSFALEEIPLFVKVGAIIPMATRSSSREEYGTDPMILKIFPETSGSASIYDDQGNSNDYKKDQFVRTEIKLTQKGRGKTIKIKPVRGSYPGMPESRTFIIKLALTLAPDAIKINKEEIPFNNTESPNSWSYDGTELCTEIRTRRFGVDEEISITVQLSDYNIKLLSGKPGKIKKMKKFITFLAKNNWDKAKYSNDLMVHTAQTGLRLSMDPRSAADELEKFDGDWLAVLEMLEVASAENEIYRPYLDLLKAAD
ncbi:DUF5110 domain-containing protein [bacterium]|nr:DUF5110 domain-containing protein [bacterium]